MRDEKRIKRICNKLERKWSKTPDLRLCQLLTNLAFIYGYEDSDLFYCEDDIIEKGLDNEDSSN